MSKIHYFQRYHTKENIVTNNTMLLFKRLYNESTYKFNDFTSSLLEKANLEIGINFEQQKKMTKSIPDGFMSQESFEIIIETKLWSGENFNETQLLNHMEGFSKNVEKKVLVALSPTKIEQINFEKIEAISREKNIIFISTTFQEVVNKFSDVIADHDVQLKEIIEDYQEFCIQEKLIRDDKFRMRIIPCGGSYELNMKYGVYYMPSSRGTTGHNFIGIYTNKKVIGIGKIATKVIIRIENDEIKVISGKLNENQEEKVRAIIKETHEDLGWDLSRCDHEYTVVNEIYETNYIKSSPYGIQGHRYCDLRDALDLEKEYNIKLPEVAEIAKMLKEKTWK